MTEKKKKVKKPRLQTRKVTYLDDNAWDEFVTEVYGKPYCLQQQNGCYPNGTTKSFTVDPKEVGVPANPDYWVNPRDYCFELKSLYELSNSGRKARGVGIDAWLARDPKEPLPGQEYDHDLKFFWQRNFYPEFDDVVTDLIAKGLLEPGEYIIDISW